MFRIELIQCLKPWQGQEAQPLIAIGGVIPEEFLGAEALLLSQRGGLKAAGEDLPRIAAHRPA